MNLRSAGAVSGAVAGGVGAGPVFSVPGNGNEQEQENQMPIFGYGATLDPQTDEALRAGVGGPVSGASVHAAIGAGGAPSIHAGGLGYGVGLPQYSQFSQPPNAMMFPSGDVSAMATPVMSFVGGVVVGGLVTFIGMKIMKKMKKK